MSETSNKTRLEHDCIGRMEVPANVYWGIHTQRAIGNFPVSGITDSQHPELIRAYATVKRACAIVHGEAGRLDAEQAAAIVTVCDELLAGRWDDEFPLSVWNSGSGTPFNIDGRTNLMFALIWGTLGLIWIKEIYPAMSRMIEKIPKRPGAILTILLVAFMLFDGLISCAALTRANERAEGIPATSSFQMFLDKHLDDNYLALVYPNMQKVNEDGTKSEPLKDTVKNT